jgi:DNA-binding MarR family transcriptional regulator
MNYKLVKDILDLVQEFETENLNSNYSADIEGFKQWMKSTHSKNSENKEEPDWEGKEKGRSPESVISTSLLHLNRYAKNYSKSAIQGSDFSTQEDFIYLIILKSFGSMTKMELIKRNIHDKSVGIKIIDRLLEKKWINQRNSQSDKRSRIVSLTQLGEKALGQQMDKIRQASKIVTGNLNWEEKMELIRLLQKLDDFHNPIYHENIDTSELIDAVYTNYLTTNN